MDVNLKIEALKLKYEAKMKESLANMDVYLNNTTGIGEHPDIIESMSQILEKYDSAKGKLDSLYEMINTLNKNTK